MLMRANPPLPQLSSSRLPILAKPLPSKATNRPSSQSLIDRLLEVVRELGGEAGRDRDEVGGVISNKDRRASDNRHQHAVAAELLVGDLEEVLLEDDQIGQLVPRDGADLVVGPQEARRVDGDGADGLLAGQAALGARGEGHVVGGALEGGRVGVLGVAAAGDADLEGEELVEGVDLWVG